ncbi:MAG: hypothetical protein HZB33_08240 [Nitrospirae bacterium]|nr:hypothetical protein [Nitrospirota bacterium]
MLKKAVLMVFATMLLIAFAGIASANQVDGMVSGTGPVLPVDLDVSVNPGGLGDGLIYGYYNARDAFTFFRVVNTSTTEAIKARVRFREAKRSKEILDFNICLSNKDQWSAWIFSPTAAGPAIILPTDGGLEPPDSVTAAMKTITAPAISANGQAFKYSATGPAGLAGVTADDTKEGYFEIIGVTTLLAGSDGGVDTNDSHVNFTASQCINIQSPVNEVPNVLAGNADVIVFRPVQGSGLYSYNAAAIADCDITQDFDLSAEFPVWTNCFNGLSGVDYALTKVNHIAMYNLEEWDGAETEVIINFPTKSLHGVGPWTKPFDTVSSSNCEPVDINIYNDLENTSTSTTDFSPSGNPAQPELCNEVNVIKIEKSDLLNTKVGAQFNVSGVTPFTGLGWVRIGLNTGTISCATGNSTCRDAGAVESVGLPSLGFVLNRFIGEMGAMDSTQYNSYIRFNQVAPGRQ